MRRCSSSAHGADRTRGPGMRRSPWTRPRVRRGLPRFAIVRGRLTISPHGGSYNSGTLTERLARQRRRARRHDPPTLSEDSIMVRHPARLAIPALAALTLACSSAGLRAQPPSSPSAVSPAPGGGARRTPETRDDWQRVSDIFDALVATRGSRIADLGAGEGFLTTRLARRVGPEGRVFAVDISESALAQLAETVAGDSLRNVELILGETDDPRLPWGTLDGVVIVNAYHEMVQRGPML